MRVFIIFTLWFLAAEAIVTAVGFLLRKRTIKPALRGLLIVGKALLAILFAFLVLAGPVQLRAAQPLMMALYAAANISHAVQTYVEERGYSVVREYVGHGVGSKMHEEPEVPNYGRPGHGPRLVPGMTLAIEPMVNMGTWEVRVLSDDWTVVTADGKPAAHYENTVLITAGDPEILTPTPGDGFDV